MDSDQNFCQRLFMELPLARPISIVDVGASNLFKGYVPPYQALLEKGYARLYGFEPNPTEFKKLRSDETRIYLPYAVGDGSVKELNVYKASGYTSMLSPSYHARFVERMSEKMVVDSKVKLETKRLDEIEEIEDIDFFKIDVQGSEAGIFRSGPMKLSKASLIRTEVAFVPLYEGQPLFADQDAILRALGFLLFGIVEVAQFGYSEMWRPFWPRQQRLRDPRQWIDADAHYLRDFSSWEALDADQLVRLIYLSIFVLKSRHTLGQLIAIMVKRGFLGKSWSDDYVNALKEYDPFKGL